MDYLSSLQGTCQFYEYSSTDCFSNQLQNPKAGEPGGYRDIVNKLRRIGFEVETHNEKLIYEYKEGIDVLVIVYGRDSRNLNRGEIASIINYVNKGGRLFIIYDSCRKEGLDTNLNELLKTWCVQFCNDLVWDAEKVIMANDSWRERIIINDFDLEHTITQGISRIWYWGCSIRILKDCIKDIKINILAKAGDDAYSAIPGVDLRKDGKGDYEPVFQPTMHDNPPYLPGQKPPVLVCCETIKSKGEVGKVVAFGARYTFNNDSINLHRFDLVDFDHEKLFFNIFSYLSEYSQKLRITPPTYKEKIKLLYSQHSNYVKGLIVTIIIGIIIRILIIIIGLK